MLREMAMLHERPRHAGVETMENVAPGEQPAKQSNCKAPKEPNRKTAQQQHSTTARRIPMLVLGWWGCVEGGSFPNCCYDLTWARCSLAR